MPRGGKRAGAGRKPSTLTRSIQRFKKLTPEEILACIDELQTWKELLTASEIKSFTVIGGGEGLKFQAEMVPNYKVRLEALKYLTDQRDGKAAQSVYVSPESDTDLDTGSLPTPQEFESRNSDKPN